MNEEHINEIVSDGEIASTSKEINISYYRPKFHQRVFANVVDILIFIFIFFTCFLGVREIITNVPAYKAKSEQLTQMRIDSGLFAYDDTNVLKDIISVLNYDKGQTAKSRVVRSKRAIDKFIAYVPEEKRDEIIEDYRSFRLDEKMTHNDIPMFVIDESNEVVENPTLVDSVESVSSQIYVTYYKKAYQPFIDNRLQAYLVISVPGYKSILTYQTNLLLWVNIFSVYCFSGLIVYILPIFIFRRGRMTFGKALYGFGLVNSKCLSPSLGFALIRFAIFYFGILVLSLFTFGLPIIISFSLMAFSKNKQGFPDYMMKFTEVDAKRTKIYLSFQEVELEKTSQYKKPVDFKPEKFD